MWIQVVIFIILRFFLIEIFISLSINIQKMWKPSKNSQVVQHTQRNHKFTCFFWWVVHNAFIIVCPARKETNIYRTGTWHMKLRKHSVHLIPTEVFPSIDLSPFPRNFYQNNGHHYTLPRVCLVEVGLVDKMESSSMVPMHNQSHLQEKTEDTIYFSTLY